MPSNIHAQTLRCLAGTTLIAAVFLLPGCAALRPSADSETSFSPDWSNALRMPASDTELSGFSDTSRQIERNLGLQ